LEEFTHLYIVVGETFNNVSLSRHIEATKIMIKVYVDWGVMSQLKQGLHPELRELLVRKNQLQVIYSTSHISDILVSDTGGEIQNERITEDLQFISVLTDNLCAHLAEKEVGIGYRDPQELFNDRAMERDDFGEDGPLSYALKLMEPGSAAYEAMQTYLNSPLPESISSGYAEPSSAEGMEMHYPGLAKNPTLGNLMKVSWQQNKKLSETDAYKEFRTTVQNGLKINKDKMFSKEEPFKELDKIYANIQELAGFDMNNVLRNDNSPSWFQDISLSYLLLDLHGYQQDNIKVDARNRDTMRNTIDDGFHAAFASMCEFYISNDVRSSNKAKQVYQKLKVNTKIFTPEEFVTYGNQTLVFEDPRTHLSLWFKLLNSPDYNESIIEDATWRTYLLEFYIFDYFNKLFVVFAPESKVPLILLSKNKPTNCHVTTQQEVFTIINKLNKAFEATGSALINPKELTNLDNLKCEWIYQGVNFRLQLLNGYLQLYMDLPEDISADYGKEEKLICKLSNLS
jgi:hypothetical protein